MTGAGAPTLTSCSGRAKAPYRSQVDHCPTAKWDDRSADRHPRRDVETSRGTISCVNVDVGGPIMLLHGNPTSSYLWRNVIPHGRACRPSLESGHS